MAHQNSAQSGSVVKDNTAAQKESVQSGSNVKDNTVGHQESVQSGSVQKDNAVPHLSGLVNGADTVIHRESVESGSYIIVSQESLQSESVNNGVTGSPNEKTFLCKSCGEPFFTAGGLRHHSQTHSQGSGRDYHCQMCSEAFFYKSGLDTHMQHAHGARNYGNASDECPENDTMVTSAAKNNECRSPKDVTTSNAPLSEPARKSHRRKGPKPEPRFWCEKCNRPYVLEFYFNVHRKKCTKIISGT